MGNLPDRLLRLLGLLSTLRKKVTGFVIPVLKYGQEERSYSWLFVWGAVQRGDVLSPVGSFRDFRLFEVIVQDISTLE